MSGTVILINRSGLDGTGVIIMGACRRLLSGFTLPPSRGVDGGDVDFFHGQHRLESALCLPALPSYKISE